MHDIIRHELGHWFVARYFGFKAEEIRIQFDGNKTPKNGYALIIPMQNLGREGKNISIHCKVRMSVLLAGVAAELLFKKDPTNRIEELLKTSGKHDKDKVDEYVYLLASINDIDEENFQRYQQRVIWRCLLRSFLILRPHSAQLVTASARMALRATSHSTLRFEADEISRFMAVSQCSQA